MTRADTIASMLPEDGAPTGQTHPIGHENVSLFSGSWAEWTTHPGYPVTTGDKP